PRLVGGVGAELLHGLERDGRRAGRGEPGGVEPVDAAAASQLDAAPGLLDDHEAVDEAVRPGGLARAAHRRAPGGGATRGGVGGARGGGWWWRAARGAGGGRGGAGGRAGRGPRVAGAPVWQTPPRRTAAARSRNPPARTYRPWRRSPAWASS